MDVANINYALNYKITYNILDIYPEAWNSFCRTKGLTKDACINILKGQHKLVRCIEGLKVKKTIFKTNQSDITHLIIHQNHIYISSDDQSLKVFDFNGNMIKSFLGHLGGIWTFDILNNRLVTGSTDKTARIWDNETNTTMRILKGHKSIIRILKCLNNFIVTGSRDHTIGIWNEMGDLLYKLEGHKQSVRCLDICNEYLVSGSYDGTVKLWDYKRGRYIRDISQHDRRVYCVKIYNGYIGSSGLDTDVIIQKIDGTEKSNYKFSRSIVAWLDFHDNCVVSSSLDGIIVKYDFIHKKVDFSIQEKTTIKGQKVYKNLIIIATLSSVKIYSFHTGRLIKVLMDAYMISKIEMDDYRIVVGFITDGEYKVAIFDFKTNSELFI